MSSFLPRLAIPATLALFAGASLSLPRLASEPARQGAEVLVRDILVPGKPSRARVWTELDANGVPTAYSSVSLDGVNFSAPKQMSYDLRLRFARHDPLIEGAAVPAALTAGPGNRLHVVQYWTQGLEDYRAVVRELGGEIELFLANHSNVVTMDDKIARRVAQLPFVRSVSPFHPAFKLEEELLSALAENRNGPIRVNLLTMRRGGHQGVIRWVEANGGVVNEVSEPTYLMSATIDYTQLAELAARNDVQWIDRWAAPEDDMDIARQFHGAKYLEENTGLRGTGVRVEVMDSGCDLTHPDMTNFLVHNTNNPGSHGTCTSGIIVGTGVNNTNATGAMPEAFLVVADYTNPYAGGSRYTHSAQLQDPALSYECVLQSNSWGSGLTTNYNSTSQNMDVILFDLDRLSILQSQSNEGTQFSRPQAWAKNIIAVGGVFHSNSLTKADDSWSGGASIGPAADGRIKPDLASFYDSIRTLDRPGAAGYSPNNYTGGFGGTSGATPIVAGTLGLFYQMWSEGLFGNNPTGTTVFENRPTNVFAKAMLINTAIQWELHGDRRGPDARSPGVGTPEREAHAREPRQHLLAR